MTAYLTLTEWNTVVALVMNGITAVCTMLDTAKIYQTASYSPSLLDVMVGGEFLLITWDFFWDYVTVTNPKR